MRSIEMLPLAQRHETGMVLLVRTTPAPEALVGEVRRAVLSLEPNLPVSEIQPLSVLLKSSLFPARMGARLLSAFAILALGLAAVDRYRIEVPLEAARRVIAGARAEDDLLAIGRPVDTDPPGHAVEPRPDMPIAGCERTRRAALGGHDEEMREARLRITDAVLAIVQSVDDRRRWTFKTPQSDAQMASIVIDHMKKSRLRTVSFIGFSDAMGKAGSRSW
ncbi:MAG: hypothetical protein HC767_13525, partial [Akkermansiaceae bacterium]|nr:hypothetical protein [Akkermansiaceae bacterium]